jgi:hypothetical protein
MKTKRLALTHVMLLCGLFGCGKADPNETPGAGGSAEGGAGPEGPLLPFEVGNNWTYQVTEAGVVSLKTTTIGNLEEVGGDGPNASRMAYHVTTAKGADLNDHTESWQAPSDDEPERVVRFREQSFNAKTGDLDTDEYWDPSKLHVDGTAAHTEDGVDWLEQYSETKIAAGATMPVTHAVAERWFVVSANESVKVPAGSFDHTIHLKKVGGSSTKEYWYLRGVGKLKELGTQTEELTKYELKGSQ